MVYDMADNCEYTLRGNNDNCGMECDMHNDLIKREEVCDWFKH